jgi:hypothetical protein
MYALLDTVFVLLLYINHYNCTVRRGTESLKVLTMRRTFGFYFNLARGLTFNEGLSIDIILAKSVSMDNTFKHLSNKTKSDKPRYGS